MPATPANRFADFTHAELAAIYGGLLLARDAWEGDIPGRQVADALLPELSAAIDARTLADLTAA